MTNPVFLAQEIPDDPSSWTLSGEEAHHARVLRIAPGEGIDVVDGRGTRLCGTVAEVTPAGVRIDASSVTHEGDGARIVLVQALAKGGRDEDAIEMATEVGAHAVARTCEEGGTALVLHESATTPLHHVALSGDVLIVVGPEGGVSPRELEALAAEGATAVVAGPHVMRSGTAGPVAVSHLARTVGRWGTPGRIGATAPERLA